MKNKNIIIVGGGIGGLTIAKALSAKGFNIKILEQTKQYIPTSGAGFGLSPNGLMCLHSLGLEKDLKKILHPLESQKILGSHGNIIYDGNIFETFKEKHGFGVSSVLRAELIQTLTDSLPNPNILQYDKQVVQLYQDDFTIEAKLANNEIVSGDLMIGADGIGSTVAKLAKLTNEDDQPVYSGNNIFFGVINQPPNSNIGSLKQFHYDSKTLLQILSKGMYIQFPVGTTSGCQTVWAQTYQAKAPPNKDEWTPINQDKIIQEYLDHVQPYHEHPIYQAIKLTPTDRLLHFGLFYRKPKEQWYNRRVCLLGDACHATLPVCGQGANQAIEDAIVLTQCLESFPEDHEKAFQQYYEKRFAGTKDVVTMSRIFNYLTRFS